MKTANSNVLPAKPLALEDYRQLIALDDPFLPPVTDEWTSAALVRTALDFLESEHDSAGERDSLKSADDARQLLRALLTVRPPAPLPRVVHEAIDVLLQLERKARPMTEAAKLPRFRLPGMGMHTLFALWQGDITTVVADAIVNAANDQLLGCFAPHHLCIDNAIHAAAGPRLREDCHRIMGAQGGPEPTACAKVTRGYNLPSRFVLHTVGPIVGRALSNAHEAELAACYRACLDLAVETGKIRSVVFCGISTGVFGFPKEPAARIALRTTREWFLEHPGALDGVVFIVFSDSDKATYLKAIEELGQ